MTLSPETATIETVDLLCFNCPLAGCDEENAGCLIRIARRLNPKLGRQIRYREWVANNSERRRELTRQSDARRKARGTRARQPAGRHEGSETGTVE